LKRKEARKANSAIIGDSLPLGRPPAVAQYPSTSTEPHRIFEPNYPVTRAENVVDADDAAMKVKAAENRHVLKQQGFRDAPRLQKLARHLERVPGTLPTTFIRPTIIMKTPAGGKIPLGRPTIPYQPRVPPYDNLKTAIPIVY
jgi:hypothetical protein